MSFTKEIRKHSYERTAALGSRILEVGARPPRLDCTSSSLGSVPCPFESGTQEQLIEYLLHSKSRCGLFISNRSPVLGKEAERLEVKPVCTNKSREHILVPPLVNRTHGNFG
ncbi:hypothetical protein STEG23_005721 [Scotinomys teguina]